MRTTLSASFTGNAVNSTRHARLRSALQSKPDYAEAHYTLGTVYKQQNKLNDAAAELREAIRLQPDFGGAHTTLAGVLRQMGDSQGAARRRKKAHASWHQPTIFRLRRLPRIRESVCLGCGRLGRSDFAVSLGD